MATAADLARTLAGLHDPEDPSSSTAALTTSIGLGALSEQHGPGPIDDAIAIAAGWRAGGADPPPVAAIGVTVDGVVEIDLARDGPHGLIAGMTGSGKSELLRTLVASLAARSSPDHLTFVLVDYKGGATFDACADLPHTVGVVTDLDDRLAERALASLDAEIRRREQLLRVVGADDLGEYRAMPDSDPLPRLVVVVDEFKALAVELPEFVPALVGIALRGRSLGIHLVLATQRPAGVVSDDIRGNTQLRMALRLQDAEDARDVVGDDGPAGFPRGTPGRTMMRLGADETVVFQSARSTGPFDPRGDDGLRLLGAIAPATSRRHRARRARPVDPQRGRPVRHRSAAPAVAPAAPGRGSTSRHRTASGSSTCRRSSARRALRWRPADGNLALLGGRGSGTTTALLSLLAGVCRDTSPAETHVYVIDARGDDRLDASPRWPTAAAWSGCTRPSGWPGWCGVSAPSSTTAAPRPAAVPGRPTSILAIDGMPALRAALDTPRDTSGYDAAATDRRRGRRPSASSAVMTGERPGAIPAAMLAGCAERWLFHLDDPAEAGVCGVPAALVPGAVPGRLVIASSRLEAQLAVVPAAVGAGTWRRSGAGRGARRRDRGRRSAAGDGLGRRRARARPSASTSSRWAPAVLSVPDGEHVLVLGPARSGRSTALARLAASWRDAHPGRRRARRRPGRPLAAGVVAGVRRPGRRARGRSSGARRAGRSCSSSTTPSGSTTPAVPSPRLAAERRHGLLVLAAGRPDALRGYGHWTAVVRRSRTGVLMSACADVDGDLLGELLPRHPPLPARPGLGWVVAGGRRALVQIGRDGAATRRTVGVSRR